jgi:light-regulated signal transduction histidine kinase (bacteriophytochrome)
MKPLLSRTEDSSTLQDLGRASFQIVHDLKNQLNGLKLYATFLKKRLEKSERPDDEQETIVKLIAGLDRAATDLSTIVQYGREIELKKQPGFDVQKVLRGICSSLKESESLVVCESEATPLKGQFDPTKLTDAFRWISTVALKHRRNPENNGVVTISIRNGEHEAVVEWSGLRDLDHDPFRSFAGSDEIRMSLAAKIVEAHGGSATHTSNSLIVALPLSESD